MFANSTIKLRDNFTPKLSWPILMCVLLSSYLHIHVYNFHNYLVHLTAAVLHHFCIWKKRSRDLSKQTKYATHKAKKHGTQIYHNRYDGRASKKYNAKKANEWTSERQRFPHSQSKYAIEFWLAFWTRIYFVILRDIYKHNLCNLRVDGPGQQEQFSNQNWNFCKYLQ